jgi:hypothetical protein
MGIRGPKDTVEVEVLLQPLKEFPDGMWCKDSFQVLSIPVKPAEKKEDCKIYWDTVTGKDEKNNPSPGNREAEIIPQKLKCSLKTAGASFAPVAKDTFLTAKSDQFSEPRASHDADLVPGDYQKKYTELERKYRKEVSKLAVNLKAVRGERDASLAVETCKNTKKLYDELKASGGALATSQKGGPNVLLLGAIGIICAILGAVNYQIITIYI